MKTPVKIRYYAHTGMTTGYGRAACEMARALIATGNEVEIYPIGPGMGPEDLRTNQTTGLADVSIVHTLPLDCHRHKDGQENFRRTSKHWVAYTTWEMTGPSPELDVLDAFDQVWVPSAASCWEAKDYWDRMRVVPHAFDPTKLPHRVTTERYTFYYIGAWNSRKNPMGVVRAFAHEFDVDEPVALHLHVPDVHRREITRALASTGIDPTRMARFTFSNERLDRAPHHADCFVSASRGEAWNLPAFEAMLAGAMVIVPVNQGSDDFLEHTNADRYASYREPAWVDIAPHDDGVYVTRLGAQGVTSKMMWLEPSISSLAEAMRHAYKHRVSLRVDYDPVERYSHAAVANVINQHLERLLAP